MNRFVVVSVLLVLCSTGALISQENPLVPDHPGSWKTPLPVRPTASSELTAEERAASTAWINQLLETLRRAPQLAPPSGVQVVPHANLELGNIEDNDESKRPKYDQ